VRNATAAVLRERGGRTAGGENQLAIDALGMSSLLPHGRSWVDAPSGARILSLSDRQTFTVPSTRVRARSSCTTYPPAHATAHHHHPHSLPR